MRFQRLGGQKRTSPCGWLVLGVSLLIFAMAGCGEGVDRDGADDRRPGPRATGAFQARVDHPLVPLAANKVRLFRGSERDARTRATVETRSEARVLDRTERVAGIPVTAVDVREYEDGELVEHTVDYYSQRRDGSVWYIGERVDDYEDGKVVGHEGQWRAGRRGAKPGLFMPATPKVGDTFEQERAPGVAEDRSRVVAVGVERTSPAGRFDNCIKTRDYAPLDRRTEFKYYCPGVGLVREERPGVHLDLVRRG